ARVPVHRPDRPLDEARSRRPAQAVPGQRSRERQRVVRERAVAARAPRRVEGRRSHRRPPPAGLRPRQRRPDRIAHAHADQGRRVELHRDGRGARSARRGALDRVGAGRPHRAVAVPRRSHDRGVRGRARARDPDRRDRRPVGGVRRVVLRGRTHHRDASARASCDGGSARRTVRQALVLAALALLVVALALKLEGHSASPGAIVADPSRTPGVLNPDVTQATIRSTICTHGWTATIRPPVEYTNALKRTQMRAYGETGPASAYQEDHLISLELGGDPTDPRNLWPEPYPRAADVDRIENELNAAVCGDRLSLRDAQEQESELKHARG